MSGNFDILFANVVVLGGSSLESTVAHNLKAKTGYILAILLGSWFLFNQILEISSQLSVFSVESMSLVLMSLVTHLSHLLLSIFLFLRIFLLKLSSSSDFFSDNAVLFVSSYWHLVEIVWIIILAFLFSL